MADDTATAGAQKAVVVLGAGLAGLSAAWMLTRLGYRVTVLEKSPAVGGLAKTKERDGFRYDLGPHNIHSRFRNIIKFYRATFDTFFSHQTNELILKRGKLVKYPLRGIAVITALRPHLRLPAAVGYVLAKARLYFRPDHRDRTYREWITRRFGRIVFDHYFKDYSEKVWGLPAERLDKYIAERRIPVIGLWDMVRALFRRTITIRHDEYLHASYYLKHGIGEIADYFARSFQQDGGTLITNATVRGVAWSDRAVRTVSYQVGGGDPVDAPCDYLLGTIPLDQFVGLFHDVPAPVAQASRDIGYCSTVLLFLQTNRREILPSHHLYFSDRHVRFSRATDAGRYSYAMVPEGKSLLCFEFPCEQGDDIWTSSVERLREMVVTTLEAERLLQRSDVDGAFAERISHTYPRFEVDFESRIHPCFSFLASFRNVISYGRQGGFSYTNTDQVVHEGFRAAEAIVSSGVCGLACWELFEAGVSCHYNALHEATVRRR